jgi:hypothetical protein
MTGAGSAQFPRCLRDSFTYAHEGTVVANSKRRRAKQNRLHFQLLSLEGVRLGAETVDPIGTPSYLNNSKSIGSHIIPRPSCWCIALARKGGACLSRAHLRVFNRKMRARSGLKMELRFSWMRWALRGRNLLQTIDRSLRTTLRARLSDQLMENENSVPFGGVLYPFGTGDLG